VIGGLFGTADFLPLIVILWKGLQSALLRRRRGEGLEAAALDGRGECT
jgi:hypothetical protein